MTKKKTPEMRNNQLARTLGILRDLDRVGGVDLYELAQRHGASVRTIRRDLEALQEVGLPLEAEAGGKKKRWRVAFSSRLTRLSRLLDVSHYLGLRMAMGQVGGAARSSQLFTSLEDLSDKVEDALGKKSRDTLAAIERCFHSYEKRTYRSAPPDVFWPLVMAITEERLVQVTYRAPKASPEEKTYKVLPLRLFTYEGVLYLMAYMPRHDNYLNLHLHRLLSLKVLKEKQKVPAGFDPEILENAAFGVYHTGKPVTFRLRFAPGVAEVIRERTWHPSQKIKDLGDGSVELTFRCVYSYEVTNWVAGWRANVEVLAPKKLRQEMRDLGNYLGETYG